MELQGPPTTALSIFLGGAVFAPILLQQRAPGMTSEGAP